MDQEYKKEIEEIMGVMKCPKDFKCCKLGVDVLCKAKDIGAESFLLCLEENPPKCTFSLAVESGYIGGDVCEYVCECPLRIYIAKKL
jgi:hypothetical protein